MKMRFIVLVALLLFPSLAQAQLKTKAAIQTEIGLYFPDNTNFLITPSITRSFFTDIVNSYFQGASVNAQTGTSYAVQCADMGALLTFNNAGAVAVSLPAASTTCFNSNWAGLFKNNGAGTVTITPASGTINGASSASIVTGQGVYVFSDGTNYQTWGGLGSSASAISSLTGDVTANGPGAAAATIAANAVTNAKLAQAPAATFKGNSLGAPANVADMALSALTDIGTPNTTLDFLPIVNHTTGTIQRTTPAEIAAAVSSGVTTFIGRTGTVTAVSGDYPATLVPYTTPGSGGVATTVQTELQRVGLWANDYSASFCGGSASDSTAFQNAINEAETLGVPVKFVGIGCVIGTQLTMASTTDFSGINRSLSILAPALTVTPISVTANAPVYLHDYGVTFASAANSGIGCLSVSPPSGENGDSIFWNLGCTNPSVGFNFVKASNYSLHTFQIVNVAAGGYGIIVANTNNVDSGDSTIYDGLINSSVTGVNACIEWQSSGGLKLHNIKCNGSSSWSVGFEVVLASGAATSDLWLTDSSIEGLAASGIGAEFVRAGSTGGLSNVTVKGNEFGGGQVCVSVPLDTNGTWLTNIGINDNRCEPTNSSNNVGFSVASTVGISIMQNTIYFPSGSSNQPVVIGASANSTNCVTGYNPRTGTGVIPSTLGSCTAIAPD